MPSVSTDNRFQGEVRKAIHDSLGLVCQPLNKNVPLSSLKPGTTAGENLEIDLVAVAGKCAILIETTTQSKGNSDKIKKFIRHCEFVRSSPKSIRERFQLLGNLPESTLELLDGISEWRFLYIGNSNELIDKKITSRRYPETNRLFILNGEHWQYLKALGRLIGRFGQYEFFTAANIGPEEIGDSSLGEENFAKPVIETTYRTVAPGTGRADVYMMVFKPSELLRIGRVLRYRGQPIAIESEDAGRGYQRILIPEKLRDIAQFIGDNQNVVFPSSLTAVLSKDCKVEDVDGVRRIVIPKRYASVDIIDGQHRLFAYAQNGIEGEVRDNATLLVTAIKFRTQDAQKINQYAAKTFVSINSTHTRVKRALIDLISYDVLGETSPRAIAAKILLECTTRPNKALSRVFRTSEFAGASTEELRPIPTVLVVDELSNLFDIEQYQQDGKATQLEQTFGRSVDELLDPSSRVKTGIEVLEQYFSVVRQVFPRDWRKQESRMMCAKYLGGFIRLFRTFAQQGLTMAEIESRLQIVKSTVVEEFDVCGVDPNSVIVFDDSSSSLPSKRETSPGKMHNLLLKASLQPQS